MSLKVKYTGKDSNGNVLKKNWTGVASDATGQYLAACVYNEYIYTSTNYGKTWTERYTEKKVPWTSITSDASGQNLAAGAQIAGNNGGVYTSSNYGETWVRNEYFISNTSRQKIIDVKSTADGKNLVACSETGVYKTDSKADDGWANDIWGNALYETNSKYSPFLATSATNGLNTILLGTSTNAYLKYNGKEYAPNNGVNQILDYRWLSFASVESDKPDKDIFYASNDFTSYETSGIYKISYFSSTSTWNSTLLKEISDDENNKESVGSIATSNDGTKIVACSGRFFYNSYYFTTNKECYGYIYTSTDSGKSWTKQTNIDNTNTDTDNGKKSWYSIASSADGTQLVACVNNVVNVDDSAIYILQYEVTDVTIESGSEIVKFSSDDTIIDEFIAIPGQLDTILLEDGDYSDPSILNIFEHLKKYSYPESIFDIIKYNLAAFLSAEAFAQAYTTIVEELTDKYKNDEITIDEYDEALEVAAKELSDKYPTWYFNSLIKIEAAMIKYRYILE